MIYVKQLGQGEMGDGALLRWSIEGLEGMVRCSSRADARHLAGLLRESRASRLRTLTRAVLQSAKPRRKDKRHVD